MLEITGLFCISNFYYFLILLHSLVDALVFLLLERGVATTSLVLSEDIDAIGVGIEKAAVVSIIVEVDGVEWRANVVGVEGWPDADDINVDGVDVERVQDKGSGLCSCLAIANLVRYRSRTSSRGSTSSCEVIVGGAGARSGSIGRPQTASSVSAMSLYTYPVKCINKHNLRDNHDHNHRQAGNYYLLCKARCQ